jgi:type I restriction enzyme S subunit
VPDAELFASPGTLAFANAGTLNEGELFGHVMYVSEMFREMAFSELILRLNPSHGSEFLYAFLSTIVGFRLLRSTTFGSKLLYLRPEFVRELPVPEVDSITAAQIANLVRKAFAAKDEALRLEQEATQVLEEEVLPQWLA